MLEREGSRQKIRTRRLLLSGRNMGARAAVIAAIEHLEQRQSEKHKGPTERSIVQLVPISYPLLGPKNELRDEILIDLPDDVDVLFIIGDKDVMCPLDLLGETRKHMNARSQLVTLKDADHVMHVKGVEREKDIGEEMGREAARWIDENSGTTKNGETAVIEKETV